ncbi:MAG: F0F1 ATP synthase subunit A [Planctomycetota bacterium]
MASGILHIRDAFYFELPKKLWPSNRESRDDFPEHWVRLDPAYQDWEAERMAELLVEAPAFAEADHPTAVELVDSYRDWRHDHFGAPFDRYLEKADETVWFRDTIAADSEAADVWASIAEDAENVDAYIATQPKWSAEKLADYNNQLSGKVFIPQPLAKLRNNYEVESGFGVSKFMLIIAVVALLIWLGFTGLARRIHSGVPARGRLWNLLEVFLMFIRDGVAKPAIGSGYEKFVPLLWTIFVFVACCNLMGMLPFVGAPTASFSVTLALAAVIFIWGLWKGTAKFGVAGFWANLVPTIDAPWYIRYPLWPPLFLIEVASHFIKHAVLAIRLLANMVAGHLVLLAIMGIAVAAAGTASYWVAMPIAVVGSIAIDCLELFVALLQAYVFTFLSAVFLGSATHHH